LLSAAALDAFCERLPKFAIGRIFQPMSTMNISLPDALKSFVDEQVSDRGYSTSSEYVRELIRDDQDRQRLRGLLLEGASSPLTPPLDDAYFDDLREQVRSRKA
jgi:antitoxin ParD1/3/4